MRTTGDKTEAAGRVDTRDALLAAAAAEFNAHGFGGTDTNRIARAAGFAPQTFYRHYRDKTDIFIRVYERWQEDERQKLADVMRAEPEGRAQALAVAATLIEAHRAWARFRRSLRLIAVEDARVRAARAASRRAQLSAMSSDPAGLPWAVRVAALLTVERLCDAAADEETGDLGIDPSVWTGVVAAAIETLRQRPSPVAAEDRSDDPVPPHPTPPAS